MIEEDQSDEEFEKMLAEIDKPTKPAPAAAPATPARRGKKTQTVVTDGENPEPALAAKAKAEAPAEPEKSEDDGFVKIAGLANQPAESVTVTVVEDAPKKVQYISPQTKAEMEAGKAVLARFG